MTEASADFTEPVESDTAPEHDYDPGQDQDTGSTNTAPPGERPSDPDSDN